MAPTPEVLKEIEGLVTSKNPISVLLSIAKIREMVLELGDSLINSVELSYYDDTATKFFDLTDQYRESGYYKIMYAYYLDTGRFEEQKAYLDKYFEESYYRDPDFFFFALDKHPFFHCQFEAIKAFSSRSETAEKYLALTTAEERGIFLSNLPELSESVCKNFTGMPAVHEFLTAFADFPFSHHPEFSSARERGGRSGRLIARDLYFASLRSEDPEYREFWQKHFVWSAFIRKELIDLLPNEEILDCFSFLRTKFLRAPKYNLALTNGNAYRILIDQVRSIRKEDVTTKLDLVRQIDLSIGENPVYRERFLNVLRKGLMYDNSIDLIDALFGISFVRREVFYEIKRRIMKNPATATATFPHLENVKSLALLLDSSFLMRLIRPFLIERLSSMFNKKSDLYYFVKFILTVHSSSNYKEYKTMTKFFVALEAHSKTGAYGIMLRFLQFGWLYFAIITLFFLAPLGTFLAVFGIAVARLVRRGIEKRFPEITLNTNLQLTGFLTVFAVISAVFGLTFARADNVAIVYSNFRPIINAVSMVASESSRLVIEHAAVKTSVMESGEGESGKDFPLSEIDYVNGTGYFDIQK